MGASGGAIRAGRAFVELFAEESPLVRGLKGAEDKLKAWGNRLVGIGKSVFAAGGALIAPLAGAVKLFSDMGSEMTDLSGRTGASVEALSTLKFAAEQTGASVEDLEAGMRKGQKTIAAAAGGSKEARSALHHLGLKVSDLEHLKPEDQFRQLAAAIARVPDPTQRAALAMAVLGKGGTKLLPMIADLDALEKRARSLGLEMSGKDAAAADALGDAWGELWETAKMGAFQIGAALAPTIQELVVTGTRAIAWAANWVKQNRELIVTVAKVAAGVAGAGLALVVLGGIISGVGTVLGFVASIVTGVGTAFGLVAAGAAFLVSPLGLVIVGLSSLTAWFLTCTETGQGAIATLVGAFKVLLNDGKAAFGGIVDAIKSGDLGLAGRIAMAFLKLEWVAGINFLSSQWNDFWAGLIETAASVAKSIAGVFVDLATSVARALFTAEDLLGKLQGKAGPSKAEQMLRELALKAIGIQVKGSIGAGIDDMAAGLRNKGSADTAAQEDDLARAQKAFDEALDEAAQKRRQTEEEATAKANAPGGLFEQVQTTDKLAKKGIGGEDVRTREGFKSIAAALRQGRDDPARKTQDNTAKIAGLAEKQYREARLTREALEDLETFEMAEA